MITLPMDFPGADSLSMVTLRSWLNALFGARREDAAQEKGAMMFTGVFMACMLTGTMWAMIGIGDAVLFKELSQEAADSASMSTVSVHARGMNLMAGINLVMLILVALYLVLCIVVTIMQAVHVVLMSACYYNPYCSAAANAFYAAVQVVEKVRDGAKSVMKTTLPVLSKVQNAAAVVMPHLGQIAGVKAGGKYNSITVSLSTSMIPGKDVSLSGGESANLGSILDMEGSDKKLGLPAIQRPFSKLCEAVTMKAGSAVSGALSKSPQVKQLENQSIRTGRRSRSTPVTTDSLNQTLSKVKNLLVSMYCNEEEQSEANWYASNNPASIPPWIRKEGDDKSFWASKDDYKGDGPKGIYGPAKNGSDWGQVWTFSLSMPKDQGVMAKVEMAGFSFDKKAKTKLPPLPMAYTSQTEFFFDCQGLWKADVCNGEDDIDMSMYSLKWTSRVLRYHSAGDTVSKMVEKIAGQFTGMGGGGGGGGGDFLGFLRGKVGGALANQLRKEGGELATRLGGEKGAAALSIFQSLSGLGSDQTFRAHDAIQRAAGKVEGLSPDSVTGEAFH
jgi:hypothetical protein